MYSRLLYFTLLYCKVLYCSVMCCAVFQRIELFFLYITIICANISKCQGPSIIIPWLPRLTPVCCCLAAVLLPHCSLTNLKFQQKVPSIRKLFGRQSLLLFLRKIWLSMEKNYKKTTRFMRRRSRWKQKSIGAGEE